MFDFEDIRSASKDEQVRAWAIEKALESTAGAVPTAESIIYRAEKIEKYVTEGIPADG